MIASFLEQLRQGSIFSIPCAYLYHSPYIYPFYIIAHFYSRRIIKTLQKNGENKN
jgi:hypothetical protein